MAGVQAMIDNDAEAFIAIKGVGICGNKDSP